MIPTDHTETRWYLGGFSGGREKVVHAEGCRFAKVPYAWADRQGSDAMAVAKALHESGAWRWHRGCRYCARSLNDAILDGFGKYREAS